MTSRVSTDASVLRRRRGRQLAASPIPNRVGCLPIIRSAAVTALLVLAAASPAVAAPLVPDDPRFGEQWFSTATTGLDAPDAWGTRTSCGTVAILDTGADLDHPDLVQNLWVNTGEIPANGQDDRGRRARVVLQLRTTAVDVAGPGDNILSTYLRNGYQTLDGTRMAPPSRRGSPR